LIDFELQLCFGYTWSTASPPINVVIIIITVVIIVAAFNIVVVFAALPALQLF